MNAAEVLFSARKYDGSLHWHCTMCRLGEDDHGVWLGMPAGTVHSKGDEGPVYESTEGPGQTHPPRRLVDGVVPGRAPAVGRLL